MVCKNPTTLTLLEAGEQAQKLYGEQALKCHSDFLLKGIEIGLNGEWSANLLTIRATQLFGESKNEDNFYYLSGLLIGDELSYLKGHQGKVFLAASGEIFRLYKIALERLISVENLVFFDVNTLERALLLGQKKIIVLNEK